MNYSFPKLIFQAVNKKLLALYQDNSSYKKQSLAYAVQLEEVKQKLITLKDPISNDFFTYSNYNTYQKSIFRDTAKMICTYSAITIRNRFLELGFDNYDRSIFDLGVTELMDKLKVFNLNILANQMQNLKEADELKDHMAKTFGFKPHPFSLNQEVVSAIFRADPIIGQECEIMMLTIYSFIQKKANQFGLKHTTERTGLDYSDFFNVACIGYLNATLYWNPKCESTKSKFKQSQNRKVFSAQFPAYGWTFAMGQITLLIYSRRMVRFPNHIEEAINRVHRAMRSRKLEIMGKNPHLSDNKIDEIIAKEMDEDIKTIQNIFAVFISPNSALTTLLPTEQRILNLNAKFSGSEIELIDIVEDYSATKVDKIVDQQFLAADLYKILKTLPVQKRVILKLRFGLKISPKEWQDSNFKFVSKIAWKNLKIQVYTLRQVGQMIDLGFERIRAIEAECFRLLRGNVQFKMELRQHLDCHIINNSPKPQINIEPYQVYKQQMYNLDLIKFNKICNKQHKPPSSIYEAVRLFDNLRLLKPMTCREAIQTIITKLYNYLNSSQYLVNQKKIPKYFWEVVDNSRHYSQYFNLSKPATFEEIYYHLTQIVDNYINKSDMITNQEKNDIALIYQHLNKNPIFLVNLL